MAISFGPQELVPLFSYEAEMSTLGSMIMSTRAAEEVVTLLEDEHFYRPSHRLIFQAMKSLIHQHKAIDLVTLRDELRARGNLADIGGEDYLVQVAEFVPSPANSAYYAGIVLDKATLRRMEDAAHQIRAVVHDPELGTVDEKVDRAEQLIFNVGQRNLGKYFQPIGSLAKEFFVDVDNIFQTGQPMTGLMTGLNDLDRVTTGHYPGDFVVIGARPSMGKTSLVLGFGMKIAQNLAREGKRGSVAVFSLEMSGIQLVRRMASMRSKVSGGVLKQDRRITDYQYDALADACEYLHALPIYIDDGSEVTPLEIRGKCRRLKAEHGLTAVIIDYLQLVRSSKRTENRVTEISEIARSLKAMAKELEVPVFALSQLSRAVENREDKRPQLSDIRESGSIEAEADMVMLIYRESYYKAKEERRKEIENPDEAHEAEIIIAKHRNGPTGKVILAFQPAYALFSDPDHRVVREYAED